MKAFGTRQGRTLAMVLVAVVPSLVACDPGPPAYALGVGLESDGGAIVVTTPLCAGDRVVAVDLILAPEGVPIDAERGVLWRIESDSGSTQTTFTVGSRPSGFEETVPLRKKLEPSDEVAAEVYTQDDGGGALISFRVSELRSGSVLAPEGYLQPTELSSRYLENCD